MRIYLPATSSQLRQLLDRGALGPAPLTAFAVTPGLRAWYDGGDDEELEYAAAGEAARASLRLIDADSTAAPRRIVVAADVTDSLVAVADELDRGVVRVAEPITIDQVASVHVDDAEAGPTVAAAAGAMLAAELGDPAAQDLVDDAEGYELAWYASQELATLLADL